MVEFHKTFDGKDGVFLEKNDKIGRVSTKSWWNFDAKAGEVSIKSSNIGRVSAKIWWNFGGKVGGDSTKSGKVDGVLARIESNDARMKFSILLCMQQFPSPIISKNL